MATEEEILKADFYDFCGIDSIWMTNDQKIKWWRENMETIVNLKKFQEEQKEWSERNFPVIGNHNYRPLLGVMEELGELAHAHLKAEQGIRTNQNHLEAKIDAIGDIVIYLSDYCNKEGLSLNDCINDTWSKVKQRDWNKNKINGE
jgi:NTP pyrophosphatase (non-canonical NTP hydrolase)